MKKYTILLIGAGAAIAFWLYRKKKAAENLQVFFKDLFIKKGRGTVVPDIFARFNIINGSSAALSVRSLTGEIFVNGISVSSVQQLERLTIPGNSVAVLTVKIVTPVLNLAQLAYNLATNKKQLKIKFEGNINSSGVLIPISEELKVI